MKQYHTAHMKRDTMANNDVDNAVLLRDVFSGTQTASSQDGLCAEGLRDGLLALHTDEGMLDGRAPRFLEAELRTTLNEVRNNIARV